MKSSDLRIGNIVAVCYEEKVIPDTVVVLEPGVVHLASRNNPDSDRDIIGVPLHEEWLKKFNFKYHFNSDEWTCDEVVIKRIQSENTNTWLAQSETFKKKIAFVHQLQDLLR
ncbi:MAG: hypothetical protein M3Z26_11845 [Bacteroidota bacterium]|nr:hypothetical protein [Bacteroidota bacterium]